MTSLVDRVRHSIERESLIPPGACVAVAVSGGSDSVALLHVLVALAAPIGFSVVGVAHLNHRLRGLDSDEDEAFCGRLAVSLGLPFDVERVDVGTLARAHRVSVEVAARRARYRFLERAATRLDADTVATGHTRDDQAETFLLRLLRGAGATGLAAIPPRRGMFVRPLLSERRHDLRAFLAGQAQGFREDETNADTRIPRNWIRHTLIPAIDNRVGGSITDVLAREADILRDDAAFLEAVADQAARSVLDREAAGTVSMSAAELASLPPALARRVIRRALAMTSPAFQGARQVDEVLRLAKGPDDGPSIDVPGIRLERNSGRVVLCSREGRGRPSVTSFRYALPVPGRVVIPEAGIAVESGRVVACSPQDLEKKRVDFAETATIDAGAAADGLWVRSRRPGDAYRPLGLGGRKKLQDVFVDKKVPRERRDKVPLVVDARDRIVWVAGFAPSDDASVTPSTQSVVTLRVNRLGDLG